MRAFLLVTAISVEKRLQSDKVESGVIPNGQDVSPKLNGNFATGKGIPELEQLIEARLRKDHGDEAIHQWKQRRSDWLKVIGKEPMSCELDLERTLRLLDGKQLLEDIKLIDALGVGKYSSPDLKRFLAQEYRCLHSPIPPHAPPILVRFINHFLKQLGRPSLEEHYLAEVTRRKSPA